MGCLVAIRRSPTPFPAPTFPAARQSAPSPARTTLTSQYHVHGSVATQQHGHSFPRMPGRVVARLAVSLVTVRKRRAIRTASFSVSDFAEK